MGGPYRTAVTGGAGFIGSHLVDRLLDDGHEVMVLDDLSTGRAANIGHLGHNPYLTLNRVDISEPGALEGLLEGVDWVFHLAGMADIVPSIQSPLKYHKANVDGTVALLEEARAAKVSRLVYAASASCYGIPDQYPTPEITATQPMYPYALSKYVGEQYVMHWNQLYGLPCNSLRLFNAYGPRSRTTGAYGAVFGIFLAQKLAKVPFTVVGDGTQTRDFVYVTDVVDAFIRAAETDVTGQIFNVGSGGTYTINHLVSLLGGEVVYVPKRPGEPDCTFADTRKITRILDWKPQVSFEQGVSNMMAGIEAWRDAPVWDEKSIGEATEDWFTYLKEPASRLQV